jgi:hypothetical protein
LRVGHGTNLEVSCLWDTLSKLLEILEKRSFVIAYIFNKEGPRALRRDINQIFRIITVFTEIAILSIQIHRSQKALSKINSTFFTLMSFFLFSHVISNLLISKNQKNQKKIKKEGRYKIILYKTKKKKKRRGRREGKEGREATNKVYYNQRKGD